MDEQSLTDIIEEDVAPLECQDLQEGWVQEFTWVVGLTNSLNVTLTTFCDRSVVASVGGVLSVLLQADIKML